MSKRQRRQRKLRDLARRAAAVSALSTALFAPDVHAYEPYFSAGVFVGYTFGAQSGLELGLEGAAMYRLSGGSECSDQPRAGVGPLLQLGLLDFRAPRVTLAALGGSELSRNVVALSAELGATYRFGDHPGFGIHTGVSPSLYLLNAAFRYQWGLQEAFVGGGLRLPTYGELSSCVAIPGRPLRTDRGLAAVPAARRMSPISAAAASSSTAQRSSCARIADAGLAWERDAQLECASIPAFLQLADQLAALGAPSALVARALDAACDEIRHALLCAALASRHLRQAVVPSLPQVTARQCGAGVEGLVQLAIESWLDGCVSEGSAARQAALAARCATDSQARAVQYQIAVDEARHAELAWSTLGWALARGGAPVRDALYALHRVEGTRAGAQLAPEGLEHHGRLAAATLDHVTREHVADSRHRLRRALDARPRVAGAAS